MFIFFTHFDYLCSDITILKKVGIMEKDSILITGCGDGGIGSSLAHVFQQRGYHVFATNREPNKMASLKDLPNVTLLALDVTNKSHIQDAVEAVSSQTSGKLFRLVNNAARNHFMPLLDDDIDAAEAIFETNVWGPLAVTQAFAPLFIEAQGTLVSITSIAGHGAIPTMGVSNRNVPYCNNS